MFGQPLFLSFQDPAPASPCARLRADSVGCLLAWSEESLSCGIGTTHRGAIDWPVEEAESKLHSLNELSLYCVVREDIVVKNGLDT